MKKIPLMGLLMVYAASSGLFAAEGSAKQSLSAASEQQTVVIAFTANERGLHASSQTEGPASGFATVMEAIKKSYPSPLFVHLGNFMGPTPSTIVTKGKFDFQTMEKLGFNLLHISNHEFVLGDKVLVERIKESRIPVVSGNLGLPESATKRWSVLKSQNRSVGFIGLTTNQFNSLVNENYRSTVQLDSIWGYTGSVLEEMKGKADIVVALTDLTDDELQEARGIDGINVILSLASSSSAQGGEWISISFPGSNKAAVVRVLPSPLAMYVVEIKLVKSGNRWVVDQLDGDYFPITKQTAREKTVEQWATGQITTIRSKESEKIGDLKAEIKNDKVREQGTELGTTVTNLMRNLTRAHVALVNSGALRDSLPKGSVSHWDLIEAMPYPNFLVVKRLTGAQLEAVIVKSQSLIGKGGYLQWSGLETEPAALGNRVSGARIIQDKKYDVAMLDFQAQGGDGYSEFASAEMVKSLPFTLQDMCVDYFKKYGTIFLPNLPLDSEFNFWFGRLSGMGGINASFSDPDNAVNYPDQWSLISQQFVNASVTARIDLNRKDFIFGMDNFAEVQYGMNWDKELLPSKNMDQVRTGSQLTLYSSNFLFAGALILDPYVSGVFDTVILFPDPYAQYQDPSQMRPGSLQLAGGLETTLFQFLTVKLGFRWQNQAFDPAAIPQTGLEGILSMRIDPFPGILSLESRTEAFSSFEWEKMGVNISSEDSVMLQIGQNLRVGPRVKLFYNTIAGKLAYLIDTKLEMQLQL